MRRADILGVVLSYQDEVMLVGKEEGHHFGLSQAVRHLLLCCETDRLTGHGGMSRDPGTEMGAINLMTCKCYRRDASMGWAGHERRATCTSTSTNYPFCPKQLDLFHQDISHHGLGTARGRQFAERHCRDPKGIHDVSVDCSRS